jgi:diaminopimelate epimerase
MEIPFCKYHGTGNDFVLIDNREKRFTGDETAFFAAICHRRFGIGADGVILLNRHSDYDFEMDYFNSDGNRSSMCGNGGRCIVQFAHDLGIIVDTARFIAVDGAHEAKWSTEGVNLKMGIPTQFKHIANEDFWIHTGSPHFVRLGIKNIDQLDVPKLGREIRYQAPWGQSGTNVNFVEILSADTARVRTYERGVEDETWSCGTGVTAVAEVMGHSIPDSPTTIKLLTPGGMLKVHRHVGGAPWLEGAAVFVFQGTIDYPNYV